MIQILQKNSLASTGIILLFLMVCFALVGPFIHTTSPTRIDLKKSLHDPVSEHPFGCDQLGRDLLARTIHGTRISLLIGLVVTSVSLILGTIFGLFAGYKGGWIDILFNWIFDTALSIPGLLLAISIIAILGPSLLNLVVALCILGWVGYARLARGLTLRAKENDFISAAKLSGSSSFRIMTIHILPNIAGPLLVQAAIGMAGVIITESTLSFLGLAGEIDAPSWGSMLNDGLGFILVAPHLTIFPGFAIATTVLALNFIGDGLRDLLDPKFK